MPIELELYGIQVKTALIEISSLIRSVTAERKKKQEQIISQNFIETNVHDFSSPFFCFFYEILIH